MKPQGGNSSSSMWSCSLCQTKFLLRRRLSYKVLASPLVSHILVVVFVVFRVEAVEDGASKREDGGSPGQAVTPVKFMIHPQTDRLYELNGEQDQAAHLKHHCKGQKGEERRYLCQ